MEGENNEHSLQVIKAGFLLRILHLGFEDQIALTVMELVF